jgi:hypothetical protein
MNSRERFLKTMGNGGPDRVPYFEEGIREEVIAAWRRQGLPPDADLSRMFPCDRRETVEPDLEPSPAPCRWPAAMDGLEGFRKDLDPDDPGRLPDSWPGRVRDWRGRDHVLMLRVHRGLFLSMGVRDWRRFNEVMMLLVDDPAVVREAMMIQGEFAAGLAERVLREVEIDAALFVEPIGGNDKPLISPKMYEEVVLRSYGPLFEVLDRFRVETRVFMTFANSRILLPGVLKRGFNCLWACEVNIEAMDYRDIRREFGKDLRLIGGIDLDALRGDRASIRREVEEKVPPLLADGGYVPLADGRVREDVPFENYVYYRQLLETFTR